MKGEQLLVVNKERKSLIVGFISIVILLFVFAISGLILVNIGLNVYKNVVLANNANFELRTSLSYVATKIRQSDTVGRTYIEEKDGIPVLVLGEEIDGTIYETLIYHYNGYLCELFREDGMDYELDYGMEVMEINKFTIEETDDGLLKMVAGNKAGEEDSLIISPRTRR